MTNHCQCSCAEAAPKDIVDTTPYNGKELGADSIVKILLGGINRRVDRSGEN
jgi:hypothetical protein